MTPRWWWISALITTGACTGSDPGIVKNDCPGTPKIVSLDQAAPFWAGLERLHFTVPDGVPSSIEVETFNPALGTWTGFPTSSFEQDDADDSYAVSVSVNPNEDTKDASFKLRVRALLDNCPPSDWATTETFTLGDPVSDTSWKAHVDSGDFFLFLQPTVLVGAGTTTGPYTLAASGIDHTIQFHASGSIDETWAFEIESAHAGDLYAGCKFSIHYGGQWHWQFTPFFRIVISGLAPAPAPLTFSTCTSPAIAELAINQAGFTNKLQLTQVSPSIDYSRLLFTSPGKVIWQQNQELNRLSQLFQGLSDTVGADQTSLQGSISFNTVVYTKQ